MEELLSKWENIKESVKIEHSISDIAYNTWIVPLVIHDISDNTVLIKLPKELDQAIGFLSGRYLLPFKVAISEAMHKEYNVKFITEQNINEFKNTKEEVQLRNSGYERANLNPKYTFDKFVVGSNNRFAHSACVAAADAPGEVYNPLFIYGGVGLGKTHLMHSIGHYIIDNNPSANVLYVTSEQFTNEVIESIREGNGNNSKNQDAMKKLRDKYRNIDVLLIDDIQFIIGKERTQEEFFHTFNQLHEQKKQIVISSDKPPKDMDILEERFKSRFGWGLIADIQTPDFETRTAILQKKMEIEGINIDDSVIKYIADNVKSNIRELEGALTKLIAFSNLENKKIDIELAKDALKDIVSPNAPVKLTPDYIIRVVCDHYNITQADLSSSKRNKELVLPRYMTIYLCRTLTDSTYKGIGALLGNRDHSTIMHGEEAFKNLIETDNTVKNTLDIIINKLNSN